MGVGVFGKDPIYEPGFPSYFTFPTLLAMLPTMIFLRTVKALVN